MGAGCVASQWDSSARTRYAWARQDGCAGVRLLTRAQLALDIVRFMDALRIDRCPVIAHDWGGIIACKLALDHPDRVERLCMMDTICTGWPVFVQYYYWFMDGDRAERFFAKHSRSFIDFLIGGRLPNGFPVPPESPFPIDLFAMTAPDPWATKRISLLTPNPICARTTPA